MESQCICLLTFVGKYTKNEIKRKKRAKFIYNIHLLANILSISIDSHDLLSFLRVYQFIITVFSIIYTFLFNGLYDYFFFFPIHQCISIDHRVFSCSKIKHSAVCVCVYAPANTQLFGVSLPFGSSLFVFQCDSHCTHMLATNCMHTRAPHLKCMYEKRNSLLKKKKSDSKQTKYRRILHFKCNSMFNESSTFCLNVLVKSRRFFWLLKFTENGK